MEGKVKLPWPGLNTEQIRYEHRFLPFRNILAPPPVSYTQYKDMTSNRYSQQTSTDLYIMACKSFQQAKTLLEAIPDPNEEVMKYQWFEKHRKQNFNDLKNTKKTKCQ